VNIHPTKTEIKFADEQAIFQILLAATKEALGKFNVAPSLDFTSEQPLDIPQQKPGAMPIAVPRVQLDPTYNPFKSQAVRTTTPKGWEQLYEPLQSTSIPAEPLFEVPAISEATPLFQWDNRYILAPTDAGLMMIHQHRAHARVLYKVLLEQITTEQAATQPLLFPEIIELTDTDLDTLERLLPELRSVGFDLEQFSPSAYSINAIPALLGQKNAVDTIMQVLHNVQDTEQSATQQWQESIALSLALQMAIPQGKALTEMEMRDLVQRLMQTSSPRYLPNGQTIITILTHEEIQKRF
jgi:DNA mismatch repair protein MutL